MGGGDNLYGYANSSPTFYIDPDGQIVVIVAALWGAYELGSSIWDAWETAKTLFDDCASWQEKSIVSLAFVAGIFAPGGGYTKGVKVALEGQVHHAISKRIFRELEVHPTLQGLFQFRDARFATQAVDMGSHIGYQNWHRQTDDLVVDWLKRHQKADAAQFSAHLRRLYRSPALQSRFPRGL